LRWWTTSSRSNTISLIINKSLENYYVFVFYEINSQGMAIACDNILKNSLSYISTILTIRFSGKLRITFRLYATFFVCDERIAKQFHRTKNVAEKKAQRAHARLLFS